MTAAPLDPGRILRELSDLWEKLGEGEETGVLRACAMTLIAVAGDGEDATAVSGDLAGLMHDHPSRAIVLRVRRTREPLLDSRVFAQCWMPFGSRQQICCEQIEITAGTGCLADVPAALLSLVAPDLPVVLVCRDAKLFGTARRAGLFRVAGKVIADSHGSDDPAPLLKQIRAARAPGRRIADLAWVRLTPWREALARVFDRPGMAGLLDGLEEVRVEHAGAPAQALYLAGWLAGGAPRGTRVLIEGQPGSGHILRASLRGQGLEAALFPSGDSVLELHVNGIESRQSYAPAGVSGLLREELAILGQDPVYEEALARAAALAEA